MPLPLSAAKWRIRYSEGVAQEVVGLGPVPGEVERFVLEDGDQIAQTVHQLLAVPELMGDESW